MRHSSSWPDRAPQTVKMRVDPLSRAFTIIPTSRETVYRLEQTAPRSDCLEEVIFLDRCAPGGVASVTIKRRLIDGKTVINKKPANFAENSSDANNEARSVKTARRYFMPRSLSSIETSAARQNAIIMLEEKVFRDQTRCKSDFLVKTDEAKKTRDMQKTFAPRTTSDMDFQKLFPKNQQSARKEPGSTSARLINEPPSIAQTKAFDVIANIADERLHAASVARANSSQTREADGARKNCQTTASSASSSSRHTSSPPHINVIDYDDYVTSVSFSSKADHACPKCTSDGVLRSRIDPFRSPSRRKKNDNALGVRRDDSIGKNETRGVPRVDERQSKDIWHGERLIGAARNADGKKSEQQRRNDGSPPARLLLDVERKEATLRRHYYPEGGWGYIIVTCSMLVHFIGLGLQLAAPGCWHVSAQQKFRHPPLHSAGKKDHRILNYVNYLEIIYIIGKNLKLACRAE